MKKKPAFSAIATALLAVSMVASAQQTLPQCYLQTNPPGIIQSGDFTDLNNYGNWMLPAGGLPIGQEVLLDYNVNGIILPVTGGEVVSVIGPYLTADNAQQAYDPSWASTMLDNTEVLVNGAPTHLIYAGQVLPNPVNPVPGQLGQILAYLPNNLPAGSTIQVRQTQAGGQCVGQMRTLQTVAQAGALYKGVTGNNALAVNLFDAISGKQVAPVAANQYLTIYGWGFGQLTTPVQDGTPAPLVANPLVIATTVTFTIGGQQQTALYAGAMPGGVGLYQFNLQVPNLGGGTYAAELDITGQTIEQFSITVQ